MFRTAIKTVAIASIIIVGTAGAAFAKSAWADGDSPVYSGPTKFHKVVNWLDDGDKVKIITCKDNKFGVKWCKIQTKGPNGYVRRSDLDLKAPKKWGKGKNYSGVELCFGDKQFSMCLGSNY